MKLMPRQKDAMKKGAVRLVKNLVGLALLAALAWAGLKLAKVPMPRLQPNEARFLDLPE
jgi:hypothetical protein